MRFQAALGHLDDFAHLDEQVRVLRSQGFRALAQERYELATRAFSAALRELPGSPAARGTPPPGPTHRSCVGMENT